MKIKAFIVAVILCLLCGCAYTEPNAQYTVTALGFTAKNGKTGAFLQAIDAAGGEQNGQPVTFVVSGWGYGAEQAIDDIKTQLSKKPSFKHCQLVLISDGIEKDGLSEVLTLCRGLDISLKTRLAYCKDIEGVLQNDKISSGTDIAALIKQNSEHFGYGAHTAIFEISTALLAADGNFALPVLQSFDKKLSVKGMLSYSGAAQKEYLSIEESIRYAKKQKTYEGEE